MKTKRRISVSVALYAYLSRYAPTQTSSRFTVELDEGTTVDGLLSRLGIPARRAKLAIVNARQVEPTSPLREGDEVSFFPPIAGGMDRLEGLVAKLKIVAKGGKLRCPSAHELAREFAVEPKVVGTLCNELSIKITNCQLGCF